MEEYITGLLFAFALTQFMEWCTFALLTKVGWGRAFLFMLNINAITWPILQVLYSFYPEHIYLFEVGVALAEGLLIRMWFKWYWVKSILLGFILNVFSYFVGSYIYEWFYQQ
jgi:hypothetical protein